MDTLQKKKDQLQKLHLEVTELEFENQLKVEYPKNLSLKGTYWKFKNSYSCPETEKDYWWMYQYIFDVTPDGQIHFHDFQIDKYGELRIRTDGSSSWKHRNGYVLSSKKEWTKALKNDVKLIISKLS